MKTKLLIIALTLGLISVSEWSLISQVHAAQLKSHTNHQLVSKSNLDQKASDCRKEIKNRQDSKVERHEDTNLPGGGHADKDGENVDHQFEGVE
jgi:hypothetical protein